MKKLLFVIAAAMLLFVARFSYAQSFGFYGNTNNDSPYGGYGYYGSPEPFDYDYGYAYPYGYSYSYPFDHGDDGYYGSAPYWGYGRDHEWGEHEGFGQREHGWRGGHEREEHER